MFLQKVPNIGELTKYAMFFLKNHPLFCWSPILDRYTFLFWQKTLYLHLISLTKVRPKLCEKKQKNVTPKESNIHSSWLKVALYGSTHWNIHEVLKNFRGFRSLPWKERPADLLHKFTTFPVPIYISLILFVIDLPHCPKMKMMKIIESVPISIPRAISPLSFYFLSIKQGTI